MPNKVMPNCNIIDSRSNFVAIWMTSRIFELRPSLTCSARIASMIQVPSIYPQRLSRIAGRLRLLWPARGISSMGCQRPIDAQSIFCKHRRLHIVLFNDLRPLEAYLQSRPYSQRRPFKRSQLETSFPQFTPRPFKFAKTVGLWGGIFVFGVLILSPIPGWIILGGIGYGIFRLLRYLRRAENIILDPRSSLFSSERDGISLIDSLFTRDTRTREIAAKVQEMAMERVELAIQSDEEGIRKILPESNGELHYTFPTEISMNSSDTNFSSVDEIMDVRFQLQIRFTVHFGIHAARTAEITAVADVGDKGVGLTTVDVRGLRGGQRVRLRGIDDSGHTTDLRGDAREGQGKTIDATTWTSR
jgi:hypothetical protein